MPRQDQSGRWISDDGLYYWDGGLWRPFAAPAAAPRASAAPWYVGAGCGCLLLGVVLLGILTSYLAMTGR